MESLNIISEVKFKYMHYNHMKGYKIPKNYNLFVDKFYPNMYLYIRSNFKRLSGVGDIIINEFILHMYSKNKQGCIRYQRYDSKICRGVPYHEWYIQQLKDFIKNYISYSKNRLDKEEDLEDRFPKSSKDECEPLDKIFTVSREDQDSILFTHEIDDCIKSHSDGIIYSIFKYLVEGFSIREISRKLSIAHTTIHRWVNTIRDIIRDIIFEFNDVNLVKM